MVLKKTHKHLCLLCSLLTPSHTFPSLYLCHVSQNFLELSLNLYPAQQGQHSPEIIKRGPDLLLDPLGGLQVGTAPEREMSKMPKDVGVEPSVWVECFLWTNTVLGGVCLQLGVGEDGSRRQEVQEKQTLSQPSFTLILCAFGSQVEYGPCVVASDCWSLLLEFLQSFLGSHTPGAPAVFGNRHDAVYGPADTMVQYMELFNKIRKQQQVPVAGIRQ